MSRFITELSADGELLSAEHDLSSDMLQVDILHERMGEELVQKRGAFTRGISKGHDVAY